MSENRSRKLTRRAALAASLGTAGIAALGGTHALAAPGPAGRLKGKRVLLGISDFSESLETYYIRFRLMEEGVEPVVIAPAVKRLELVIHYDQPGYLSYVEKPGYPIDVDLATKDVDPAEYDGLILPGGRAPEELRLDKPLIDIVGHFLDQKKPLGAMCHGVMLLYTARPIKGLRLAANRHIGPDIEQLGGEFVDEPVVVQGSLVTSRGWTDLHRFMPKFIDILASK